MGVKIEVSDRPATKTDPQDPVPAELQPLFYNPQADIKPPSPPPRAPGTPANLPRSDQGSAPFRLK